MSTSQHSDEEVESMYEKMMGSVNGQDYLAVIEDWNAVVGEARQEK